MAKIWIHIGSHKTGTTSIQKTFSSSRDILRDAGLTYPWNRMWFPTDPENKPRGYAQHYLVKEAKAGTLRANLAAIHAGFEGDEWIVSSELLSAIKPRAVAHVLDALAAQFSEIHAIMYVREPGKLVVSRTATHIVMGRTTYEAACAEPKIYPYRRNMTPWLRHLGKDRFTVRVYDRQRLRNGNVVDDLLDATGRDPDAIPLDYARKFVTPSHDAVMAMSERNARGEGHLRGGGWARIPGPPFTLPPEIVAHVRRESAGDVAWLRREFGIEFEPSIAEKPARSAKPRQQAAPRHNAAEWVPQLSGGS